MIEHPAVDIDGPGRTDREPARDLPQARRVLDHLLVGHLHEHPVGDLRIPTEAAIPLVADEKELADAPLLFPRIHVALEEHVAAVHLHRRLRDHVRRLPFPGLQGRVVEALESRWQFASVDGRLVPEAAGEQEAADDHRADRQHLAGEDIRASEDVAPADEPEDNRQQRHRQEPPVDEAQGGEKREHGRGDRHPSEGTITIVDRRKIA